MVQSLESQVESKVKRNTLTLSGGHRGLHLGSCTSQGRALTLCYGSPSSGYEHVLGLQKLPEAAKSSSGDVTVTASLGRQY